MKNYNDVYFLVDIDNTFFQVVKTRKAWLKPFDYEVDNDNASANIDALLKEEIDAYAKPFGKYEEAKSRIIIDIKIASKEKKRKKMIEDLENNLRTQGKGKVAQGIGEDEENDRGDEEEEESVEKKGKALALVPPPKKKAKIVKITKPKVKKIEKKTSPKTFSPAPQRLRTRAILAISVEPLVKKGGVKITKPSSTSA